MNTIEDRTSTVTSIAVAIVLTVLALSGCVSSPTGTPPDESTPVYEPAIEPAAQRLGGCFDKSKSNDPSFAAAGLDAFVAAVRALPIPTETGDGPREPVPSIDVTVRQVSANSRKPTDELVTFQIPGVPGLVEQPDAAEFETFATRNKEWRAARQLADEATADAQAAREQLLELLAAIDPISDGSEVWGCLTALRDSFPPDTEFGAVLVSDLEQTGPPQIRGDYSGMHVVVAHTCSDVDRCDATESDWQAVFDSVGVGSASFVSIGQLGDELLSMLGVQ